MAEITKDYAAALFLLAKESGKETAVAESMKQVAALMAEHPEYGELLSSPAVSKAERLQLAAQAFEGRIEDDLLSFVYLLCEKGHMREFCACAEEFEGLYRDSLRRTTAIVRSAVALTEDEKAKLAQQLSARTGKEVSLSCTVDPSLLGGVSVELDGTVYDGSLRRRLYDMKKVMDE